MLNGEVELQWNKINSKFYFFSKSNKKLSIKRGRSSCKTVWHWKRITTCCHPKFSPIFYGKCGCAQASYWIYSRLAVTGMRLHLLPHPAKPHCYVLWSDSGLGLQSLVRKCLRVRAACSAKSHFILLMDGWTDGCLVKAALSGSFYGTSEWWIALFLLSPNHHRSKPYFSGQKPSNIKTHNQVKLLAV